jgi:hypothetical protein
VQLTSAICRPSHVNPYLALAGAGPLSRDVSKAEQASGSQGPGWRRSPWKLAGVEQLPAESLEAESVKQAGGQWNSHTQADRAIGQLAVEPGQAAAPPGERKEG